MLQLEYKNEVERLNAAMQPLRAGVTTDDA